jgi:hypothetical protein
MMMKRSIFRQTAIALMIALVAFTAACSGDDPVEPDPPKPSSSLETISITAPAVKDANRTITDKAGEFSYSDKADATVKMTFRNAEPAAKDSAIVIDLVSKAAWSVTPITISALTGEIVQARITTTANNAGLTFDFGAFKLENVVKFTNPSYTFTEGGKSAQLPFYGFNEGDNAGMEPVVVITSATEGGKVYKVITITQAFKLKHSDGTLSKEVSLSAVYKEEVTKRGNLVKSEQLSWTSTYYETDEWGNGYYECSYNIRMQFESMTKDTPYVTRLYLLFSDQSSYRIFLDKPTVTTPVVINIGEVSIGIPKSSGLNQPYIMSRADVYKLSALGLLGDDSPIGTLYQDVSLFRGTSGDLVLSTLPITVAYKSVSYEASFEETISGKVYTITPVKVFMTFKLGDKLTEEGWVMIELAVEKK